MSNIFKERLFLYPFSIWLVVLFYCLIFLNSYLKPQSENLDNLIIKNSFYLLGEFPQQTDEITIVAIDAATRTTLNLKWPWPRKITAQLIKKISSYNPKVIACDIIFSGKSDKENDQALSEALSSAGNIVLASRILKGGEERPFKIFSKKAKYVGFVNKPKIYGTIKEFFPLSSKKEQIRYSLELATLATYKNLDLANIKIKRGKIISHYPSGKYTIPSGKLTINWLAHPADITTISAFSLLKGNVNPLDLKNKIVLVGVTDPLIHDIHSTPLGEMPGIYINANSLLTLLTERYIRKANLLINIFLIFLAGFLILIINHRLPTVVAILCTLFLVAGGYFSFLALRIFDIKLPYLSFFLSAGTSFLAYNINKYTYLIYVSNRLKNIALTQSITGLLLPQYFTIKLENLLKTKRSIRLLGIKINNLKKIKIETTLKERKTLLSSLSKNLKKRTEETFKKSFSTFFPEGIFAIALEEADNKKIEQFSKNFIKLAQNSNFLNPQKNLKLNLSSLLLYPAINQSPSAKNFILSLKNSFDSSNINEKEILIKPVEETLKTDEENLHQDIAETIESILDEKDKEKERSEEEKLYIQKQLEEAYFQTTLSLIKALEEKDTYTKGHSQRVANYALAIAQEAKLSEEECELIYKAALLHDIGKIGIPDYILHKKEKLTQEEIDLIRRHQFISVEILKPIKPFEKLIPIVAYHHERYDGTGYPYGLSADMIPKGAQILSVADSFDAIVCGRGYKKGSDFNYALEELEKNKGKQFSPFYADILIKLIRENRLPRQDNF